MKSFREYIKLNLDLKSKVIQKLWRKNNIFKYSLSSREGKKKWIFYEGPPSSNGLPGIHHLLGCSIKDIFCRYQTLKGNQAHRRAGWDSHGLPIELGVEKCFNIKKEDIGKKISILEYNKVCYESVICYINVWKQFFNEIGYWIDHENAYFTYNSKYIETIWFLLKELFKNNFIHKKYTVHPYSPMAGTGLSSHELNIPGVYKSIIDITIIVKFKIREYKLPRYFSYLKGRIYLLAWTTTPWSLPSNTALSVGNIIKYFLIETINPNLKDKLYIIITIISIYKIISSNYIPFRIIYSFYGEKIIGIQYDPVLPWFLPYKTPEKAFKVVPSDIVSISEGTGIIHIAPPFGYDDELIAKKNGIPFPLIWNKKKNMEIPLIDLQGRFIKGIPFPYAGRYIKKEYKNKKKSLDLELALILKKKQKVFKINKYKHTYPHCWRTNTPILYYPLYSWTIRTSFLIEEMIYLNNSIRWIPFYTGKNRFGNWLRKLNDWNLSRSRYWGIPLPIWKSKDQSEEKILGSIEELIIEIKKSIKINFMKKNPFFHFEKNKMNFENYKQLNLHKPMIDNIILTSSRGKPLYREDDLVDVWFDSGSMPFAQLHYPFENKNKIHYGEIYPADFISEGIDQTRGWFYTLHAISSMLFRSIAYKNVMSNGLILDKFGQKMSKSKGNIINPFEILRIYGSDAVRLYLISNNFSWENIKFNLSCIDEVRRKFFRILYNIYTFFALYSNIDIFFYKEDPLPIKNRFNLDKWILSELNILIENVEYHYNDYNPTRAIRTISYFVSIQLSNWYIRLSRKRFWKSQFSQEKISAFQTLYEVLLILTKISAPITPFFSDFLYKNLIEDNRKELYKSVHLSFFPKKRKNFINLKLQETMFISQRIVSIVLALRKKENIKVRQPLKQLKLLAYNNIFNYNSEIIKQEINVKNIFSFTKNKIDDFLLKEIKPNYNLLVSRFGIKNPLKLKKVIKFSISQINDLEEKKYCFLAIEDKKQIIKIEEVDILTKKKKGWVIAYEDNFIIALDIFFNETLHYEGITRNLISYIQRMRKKNLLKIFDKIVLFITTSFFVKKSIILNIESILDNTLSINLILFSTLKVNKIKKEQILIFFYKFF